MGRRAKKSSRYGIGFFLKLALFVVSLPFLYTTYMVCLAMLLPTGVAYMVDRVPRKYLARCVGAVNICGTFPAIIALWTHGLNLSAAKMVLSDVWYWLYAYLAAAIGWALFTGVPKLIASYVSMKAKRRVLTLRDKQSALIAEWGEEVAAEVRREQEGMQTQAAGDGAEAGDAGTGEPTGPVEPLPEFDMPAGGPAAQAAR